MAKKAEFQASAEELQGMVPLLSVNVPLAEVPSVSVHFF